jgi:hypothetical protein
MDPAGWTLCEIEYDRGGSLRRPVAQELESRGTPGERARAIGCLKLLRLLGWPEARRSLQIDGVGRGILILKCKPSPWRLYFHVRPERRLLLLVLAVCKKGWRRDPDDTKKAAKRLSDWEAGRAREARLDFDR